MSQVRQQLLAALENSPGGTAPLMQQAGLGQGGKKTWETLVPCPSLVCLCPQNATFRQVGTQKRKGTFGGRDRPRFLHKEECSFGGIFGVLCLLDPPWQRSRGLLEQLLGGSRLAWMSRYDLVILSKLGSGFPL